MTRKQRYVYAMLGALIALAAVGSALQIVQILDVARGDARLWWLGVCVPLLAFCLLAGAGAAYALGEDDLG